mgnify:CR=1 FL=1|jgi:hypothetical protein
MEDAHLRNAVSLYLVGGGSLRGYRDARIGDNPLSKHLQTNYLSLYVSQHNNLILSNYYYLMMSELITFAVSIRRGKGV